jgi:CrcB protein
MGIFSRHYIGLAVGKYIISNLPLATFYINIFGAFFIGVVYALSAEQNFFSPEIRLGLMVGFLGGFTTFSTLCLETMALIERGEPVQALSYLFLSPITGLGSVYAGIAIVRRLMGVNE